MRTRGCTVYTAKYEDLERKLGLKARREKMKIKNTLSEYTSVSCINVYKQK